MPKTRKTGSKLSFGPAVYPFSAIVGQEEMKLALILNVIDPLIGGVLMMGHRGTGKSTIVRALADLLPERAAITGCVYSCDPTDREHLCAECSTKLKSKKPVGRSKSAVPVVDFPLGATEDRVVGTIDIEQALRRGVKRFEPGLLARANRGFLYIDEVNLLEDHLVDLLLDVAATGINKVERESVSVEHPARFVLFGSGNPEEGELRPQLLDRFGLYVEVKTENSLDQRVKIVERREAFERDRQEFRREFAGEQDQLRRRITDARQNSKNVKLEKAVLRSIAQLCSQLKIDGHRGELTITRAARALAAFEGRKKIIDDDVKRVAVMSLRHRLHREPMDETDPRQRIEEALDGALAKDVSGSGGGEGAQGNSSFSDASGKYKRMSASASKVGRSFMDANGSNADRLRSPDGTIGVDNSELRPTRGIEAGPQKLTVPDESKSNRTQTKRHRPTGRAAGVKRTVYSDQRGRYVTSVGPNKGTTTVALDATLRAQMSCSFRDTRFNSSFARASLNKAPVASDALRFKLFKRKQGRLFIFAIDLSGSMAMNRITQARGFMIALLRRSYIERDSVAIVGFRGKSAELLLPPSRSILRARRVLDSVSVGGGTPLSAGLACSLQLAKRAAPTSGEIVLWLFTDGRANVVASLNGNDELAVREELLNKEIAYLGSQLRNARVNVIVVDTQNEFRTNGRSRALAERLGSQYECLPVPNASLNSGRRV